MLLRVLAVAIVQEAGWEGKWEVVQEAVGEGAQDGCPLLEGG